MIKLHVWIALTLCVVAASSVTISNFRATQVEKTAHVLLTWTPSDQSSTLTYKLEYKFLNKNLKKEITDFKATSVDVLLIAKSCQTAKFKLTPIVDGKSGTSVEAEFTFPQVPSKVLNIAHKTNEHDNNELITWSVNQLVKDCPPLFKVYIFEKDESFIVKRKNFTVTNLTPNRVYTVRISHVRDDGTFGRVKGIAFIAKYGGTNPVPVQFVSYPSPGKIDIKIQPIRYEWATPVDHLEVTYSRGTRESAVVFETNQRNFPITSYEACREFSVSIAQVTKDGFNSKPTKRIIPTKPHVPMAPVAKCEYAPEGISVSWTTKNIQGNWLCRKIYRVTATYPDGNKVTSLYTTKRATLHLELRGNYNFTVTEQVDRIVESPSSKPVSCYF